jgi:hypothetical protein
MDPYLEHPGRWPDVHHELISVIREMLNQQLNPRYYVRIEERVYISDEDDLGRSFILPDLRLMKSPGVGGPTGASAVAIAPSIELNLVDDEIHEARLEVLDREYRQVTAVIELVSPTNKAWGAKGRDSYLSKRRDVLASPAHFLEIDLLRSGTPLVARDMLPLHDYLVHLSRANGPRRKHEFWPMLLTQPLQVVAVPLREGDEDASLDLQSALATAYARGAYQLDIDYNRDPVPPLTAEQNAWARAIINAAMPK